MSTLKEFLQSEYSHNELADAANHGCQGGFGDFIYYSDTVRYFEEYRDDCFEVIEAYNDATGETGFPKYINDNSPDYQSFANSMVWFAVEWYAQELTNGEYLPETQTA